MFSILFHIGFDGIVSMITYGKAALTGFGQWEVHAWQIEWQQSGHYAGMDVYTPFLCIGVGVAPSFEFDGFHAVLHFDYSFEGVFTE